MPKIVRRSHYIMLALVVAFALYTRSAPMGSAGLTYLLGMTLGRLSGALDALKS